MGLCSNPFMVEGIPAPCGSCPPCRVSRARIWTHRILLESACHSNNAFVTLTYEDSKLPAEGLLNKEHIQTFLRNLRYDCGKEFKIRYFVAGEYGEEKGRPHYHCVLFGFPACENGITDHRLARCCSPCETLAKNWGNGSVDVSELNVKTASYVAGYVNKKLTGDDSSWKKKQERQFRMMSLKPGIGSSFMEHIRDRIFTLESLPDILKKDVPNALRHSKNLLPLGRYLKGKLREHLGREKKTPNVLVEAESRRLSELYREAIENAKDTSYARFLKGAGKKSYILGSQKQKMRDFVCNQKIFGRKS